MILAGDGWVRDSDGSFYEVLKHDATYRRTLLRNRTTWRNHWTHDATLARDYTYAAGFSGREPGEQAPHDAAPEVK